jgi:hypothetical protein
MRNQVSGGKFTSRVKFHYVHLSPYDRVHVFFRNTQERTHTAACRGVGQHAHRVSYLEFNFGPDRNYVSLCDSGEEKTHPFANLSAIYNACNLIKLTLYQHVVSGPDRVFGHFKLSSVKIKGLLPLN